MEVVPAIGAASELLSGGQRYTEHSDEHIDSYSFMGIMVGALAGGLCFVVFGLRSAVFKGGFSTVVILSKLKGRPIEQSPFVRIMVAAGIIASIALGITMAMLLGGIAGGVIESMLLKVT